jgi:GDP-D-mannose 3', 5'-epimerase
MAKDRVLVTGAGGFIGHHLVKTLVSEGHWVRGVDIKYPEFESTLAHDFQILDLRRLDNCLISTEGIQEVYNLAADMGGIGYITAYHAEVARNNVLINSNMLEASRINNVEKFLFSSSACIYPQYKQDTPDIAPLKEEDAYPADPEPGYGLEKLFTEEMCKYYWKDYKLDTRIVRFHNVYGPIGTYEGGKEKAPAAICRKIAMAKDGDDIEVWGDGNQTRSFMYIDDCVEGLIRIMSSEFREPLNLGTDRMVTINKLVDTVAKISGKKISKKHNLSKPEGVRGRNSDNTLLKKVLGWEPKTALEDGLEKTYKWIKSEIIKSMRDQNKEDNYHRIKV